MASDNRRKIQALKINSAPQVRLFDPASSQHFFKVPFFVGSVGSLGSLGSKRGGTAWLYLHFDEKTIAREIQSYPRERPALFVAGIDDDRMCFLDLDQTGLLSRKGVTITEEDFEDLWVRLGGQEVLQMAKDQMTSMYLKLNLQTKLAICPRAKPDLATWTFVELKDTMEKSFDEQLRKACRAEINLRQKGYQAWKMKRKENQNIPVEQQHSVIKKDQKATLRTLKDISSAESNLTVTFPEDGNEKRSH